MYYYNNIYVTVCIYIMSFIVYVDIMMLYCLVCCVHVQDCCKSVESHYFCDH